MELYRFEHSNTGNDVCIIANSDLVAKGFVGNPCLGRIKTSDVARRPLAPCLNLPNLLFRCVASVRRQYLEVGLL